MQFDTQLIVTGRMGSLYLHIPFCIKKCLYCSFSSCAGGSELHLNYVAALKKELKELSERTGRLQLTSLFVGGGTPTVLPCELLAQLIEYCFELFPPSANAEITVEANPGTIDERYLDGLLRVGVNRLSIGVQSFVDQELKALGRVHNSFKAYEAVHAAQRTGFSNVNLDLMYGLPGQTTESWSFSLQQAIALQPQHLSLYQLTVEEGTLLHQKILCEEITLPDEDVVLLMDDITKSLCSRAELLQYEISNYAKPGCECLHNINYWKNEEYLACGSSAVSCVDGVREKRVADPDEYIRRMRERTSLIIESEKLSREDSFKESVIMGLRMTKGVSLNRLASRYHLDLEEFYGDVLKKFINWEMLEKTPTYLKLTEKGRPLANLVMAELV
jgi:oxygen-independent coproporphyrinogen III oxidase